MTEEIFEENDLLENPTPRVPVALCLDCSGSMQGNKIDELNKGVKVFYDSIYQDEMAKDSAEISIVTFGGSSEVKKLTDFTTISVETTPPLLDASGLTPLGKAVKLSLDLLDERKNEYKNNGVEYYQPWLVLMTDGTPEGDDDLVREEQIRRVSELVENKKLTVFPIGIGDDADMNVLQQFSPGRTPLRLKGLNFADFFSWLSKSVSTVSRSTPGETIQLDTEGIKGWAEL